MHAEIIAIGDEITSGQLLDTNTQWLSQRLEEMGIRVLYHATVGDDLDACADVFRLAVERADIVIATGGLGPTADDLTRLAIARATGRELAINAVALRHIHDMFARRKRQMPKQNEQQAMFPVGAQVVHNPNGTAPGIDFSIPREGKKPCRLVALPGVPAEMREMWFDSVGDLMREAGGGRTMVRHRRINCFGAGESQIEAMLPDLIRRGRIPRVGITASQTTIIRRVTAEGPTEEACFAAMEPTVATIRECLGNLIYGEDDDQLQDAVARLLGQRDKTLSTVEWGTGGMIADWFDSANDHYAGGVVVTNENTLHRVLDVPAEVIEQHTAHSDEAARAMAVGCRRRFDTDYALAVGPFPKFDPAAPERFFFAIAGPDGIKVGKSLYAGHPAMLRILCAKRALNMLRLALQD